MRIALFGRKHPQLSILNVFTLLAAAGTLVVIEWCRNKSHVGFVVLGTKLAVGRMWTLARLKLLVKCAT